MIIITPYLDCNSSAYITTLTLIPTLTGLSDDDNDDDDNNNEHSQYRHYMEAIDQLHAPAALPPINNLLSLCKTLQKY
jgi:hypothetical protein